jgi:hypothetical protein
MLSFAAGVIMAAEVSLVAGLLDARASRVILAVVVVDDLVPGDVEAGEAGRGGDYRGVSGGRGVIGNGGRARSYNDHGGGGMRLDPAVFAKGSTLLLAGALLVAAVVSKLGAPPMIMVAFRGDGGRWVRGSGDVRGLLSTGLPAMNCDILMQTRKIHSCGSG